MQFLLALLTTLSLSLRGNADNIPLRNVTCETAGDHLSAPNYAERHRSRRAQKTPPGIPIPLSDEDKAKILNEHNNYREQVFPPAANMRYMRYSDDVAFAAQLWANQCRFQHGRPAMSKFQEPVGQNIYKGYNASYSFYISLWYDEVHDFDMKLKQCNGSKCGHYLQVVWAESFLLGCGQSRCKGKKGDYNLFVCHYHRPFESNDPYKIGRPCSQCEDGSGQFCYRNMCVSKEECEKEGWTCECNLKCHNCGVLDKSKCTCKCPPGWDFQDCSQKCTNLSDYCGKEDGFPDSWVGCEMEGGYPKSYLCRKMCGTCEDITERNKHETCCGSKLCDTGYVLDYGADCSCRLLCPGPECYMYADKGNEFRGITPILIVLIAIIHILRKVQGT